MKILFILTVIVGLLALVVNVSDTSNNQSIQLDRATLEKEKINQQSIKEKADAEIRRLERLLDKDLTH